MKKLLLDEMLRRTVKWLRIFGIDTEHAAGREDKELLEIAEKEKRILVSKDEALIQRCKKQKMQCLLLKSQKLEVQLAELKKELKLKFTFPNKTRCPKCNHPLKIVKEAEIAFLVHENVLKRFNKFLLCKNCNKAYWEGSHWKNLTRIFEQANKSVAEQTNKN